ncbi:MAG: hypothetical protein NTV86_18655 [Planctomycetota bacterium]|nr:hypothetical protein [Planctomycetota bacterium]
MINREVCYLSCSLFHRLQWQEPLQGYNAVHKRRTPITGPLYFFLAALGVHSIPRRTTLELELTHRSNPSRNVVVLLARDEAELEHMAIILARALAAPVVDTGIDGPHVRQAQEAVTPIVKRSTKRPARLTASNLVSSLPGFRIDQTDEGLLVTTRAPIFVVVVGLALGVASAFLFLASPRDGKFATLMTLLGGLFGFLGVACLFSLRPERLLITPDGLKLNVVLGDRVRHELIPWGVIRDIRIAKQQDAACSLVLTTEEGDLGSCISGSASRMKPLYDFILANLPNTVTAPASGSR